MAKTTRNMVVLMAAMVAMSGTPRIASAKDSAASGAPEAPVLSRVRAGSPAITSLIQQATTGSATFRSLVDTIDATDGLVYVLEGKCGHGVRACMPHRITKVGSNRMLRILVDARRNDVELMGSIGHELQHAVEVLTDPSVTSDSEIYFLYARSIPISGRFETDAALLAGDRVRAEVRQRSAN